MDELRLKLEQRLKEIPGLEIALWKDTELVCLFFEGKDFAHFHGKRILDMRLSSKIIREEALTRDISNKIHPDRSKKSKWIGVEINDDDDVQKVVRLVERACRELNS